jgi:hypothetical protein
MVKNSLEVAVFANVHNLNRKDNHGMRMFICWYYEGNMKYSNTKHVLRIGPPGLCRVPPVRALRRSP